MQRNAQARCNAVECRGERVVVENARAVVEQAQRATNPSILVEPASGQPMHAAERRGEGDERLFGGRRIVAEEEGMQVRGGAQVFQHDESVGAVATVEMCRW